jgi:hypothetical protein
MAVTIKRLNCTVRVETGGSDTNQHANEAPVKPQMQFAQPIASGTGSNHPSPSETATDQRGPAGQQEPTPPAKVPASRVAERVYELMVRDARFARERGER